MEGFGSWLDSIRRIMRQDTGLNGDAQRIEQLAWMIFLKVLSDKEKHQLETNPSHKNVLPERFRWENWAVSPGIEPPESLHAFFESELFPALRELKKNYPAGDQHLKASIVSEVFEGNNYMKDEQSIQKVLEKLNQVDFHEEKERHLFGELYEAMLQELQSAGKSGEFYTPRAITQFITKVLPPSPGEKILDPSCGTGGFLIAALQHLRPHSQNSPEFQELAAQVQGWEYKPLPYLLANTNLILHDVEVPSIEFKDSLRQALESYLTDDQVDIIYANPPFGGLVSGNNDLNFPEEFRSKDSAILFLVLILQLLKEGGRAGIILPDSALNGEGAKERVRQKLLQECNLHTIIRLPQSVFQPYASVSTNILFFDKGKATREVWFYELKPPPGRKTYSKNHPIQAAEFQPIMDWWNHRVENDNAWKVSIEEINNRSGKLDFIHPQRKQNERQLSFEESKQHLFKQLEEFEMLVGQLKSVLK